MSCPSGDCNKAAKEEENEEKEDDDDDEVEEEEEEEEEEDKEDYEEDEYHFFWSSSCHSRYLWIRVGGKNTNLLPLSNATGLEFHPQLRGGGGRGRKM